jgi:hypothetical protein
MHRKKGKIVPKKEKGFGDRCTAQTKQSQQHQTACIKRARFFLFDIILSASIFE